MKLTLIHQCGSSQTVFSLGHHESINECSSSSNLELFAIRSQVFHFIIREKRNNSQNYRNRSGRFFSVSTEDSSVDSEVGSSTTLTSGRSSVGAAGLKPSKQRWSGFFTNTKGTKIDLLTSLLDDYNKHGVPKDTQLSYELAFNEDGKETFVKGR